MQRRFFLGVLILFLTSISVCLHAQPGNPGNGADSDTPITGIEILVGIGGLFGVKRLINNAKKKRH